jgi:DNA polymerase-4
VPTLLALLEKGFVRRDQPVRLLGVGVRLEEDDPARHGQFALFDDAAGEHDEHDEHGQNRNTSATD